MHAGCFGIPIRLPPLSDSSLSCSSPFIQRAPTSPVGYITLPSLQCTCIIARRSDCSHELPISGGLPSVFLTQSSDSSSSRLPQGGIPLLSPFVMQNGAIGIISRPYTLCMVLIIARHCTASSLNPLRQDFSFKGSAWGCL